MIEIQHTADTIRGRLAIEGAPASNFYGWLELIDRLDRATSETALENRAGFKKGGSR
jgi:hypothetical protein